jgi:hypothetical protein
VVGSTRETCIKWTIIREGAKRRRDKRTLQNAYYEVIYELVSSDMDAATKMMRLKTMNAKIVRLHARDNERIILDGNDADGRVGGAPSIYHVIRNNQRQQTSHRPAVRDVSGELQEDQASILRIFAVHMQLAFRPIPTNRSSIDRLARYIVATLPPCATEAHETPITKEELHAQVRKGKRQKAPGRDGMSQDFF